MPFRLEIGESYTLSTRRIPFRLEIGDNYILSMRRMLSVYVFACNRTPNGNLGRETVAPLARNRQELHTFYAADAIPARNRRELHTFYAADAIPYAF